MVPFTYKGGIAKFIENEVYPYAQDVWVDEKATKIGYELSFIKYFYRPTELRDMATIVSELKSIEMQTDGMLRDILEGLEV